jgi:arylsulfate sulfotransferase
MTGVFSALKSQPFSWRHRETFVKSGGGMARLNLRILQWCSLLVITGFLSGCSGIKIPIPIVAPTSAVLLPGQTLQFSATEFGVPMGNGVWLVNRVAGGTRTSGTITSSGLYTAPDDSTLTSVGVSVRDSIHKTESTPVQVSIFEPNHFQPGNVAPSINPQVALYTLQAPEGATVQIQFGTSTNYGLVTWAQPAPAAGGPVAILVAGMRASTTYHMQAMVHLPNGNTVLDTDQQFATGALPANILPKLAVQQTPGLTPAPGVELLCLFGETIGGSNISDTWLTAVITDLEGNVIWYYPIQPSAPFPMKLLPNGHMLVVVDYLNTAQEIDLAGNIISQVSLVEIERGLAAAGSSLPPLLYMSHDIVKLPNGHLIFIISLTKNAITGDALIDWDPQKGGPVWTWSTFDHIPLSHNPYGTADWTHSNALLYSPDDGNLILSMRNQNWIVKINYNNGAGDGTILWHLGPDGDFTLPPGQAPIEWNYGQHYPVLLGPSTSGVFPLMFFNNGDGRLVDANNDPCGTKGLTPCYSSVPTFELNEYTKTARVLAETNLSPAFSTCCGSTNLLANGDLEYDVAQDVYMPGVSYIQEVTQDQNPQLVWQMTITDQLAYRGFRIPSLYPGIEWTQAAIATANAGATAQSSGKGVK